MDKIADRRPPWVPATSWLRALPPLRRWALHGERRARDLAAPVWGAPFSESACRAKLQGSRATLWLGPDEYLLLELGADELGGAPVASASAPGAPIEGIEGALEHALEGTRHALVDLSHRQMALEVSGARAETILSGACPLDLELCAFPVGMCTRTVLAKADIVLWRPSQMRFHVEIWRSFVPYATTLLGEIGLEFQDPSP
jgi:sarcosine oxidase subunit gamma